MCACVQDILNSERLVSVNCSQQIVDQQALCVSGTADLVQAAVERFFAVHQQQLGRNIHRRVSSHSAFAARQVHNSPQVVTLATDKVRSELEAIRSKKKP